MGPKVGGGHKNPTIFNSLVKEQQNGATAETLVMRIYEGFMTQS